jgi:hypothetical protein
VLLVRILPKYIPAIVTDNIYLFYSVYSVHVSAPSGHPLVEHNIIYIFMKTITPQHIRYFTIIYLYGVRLLLSIYLLYNHIILHNTTQRFEKLEDWRRKQIHFPKCFVFQLFRIPDDGQSPQT